MKRRLLPILGGFAIGCVLAVFAQQTYSADARIGQQRDLLGVPHALDEFGDINRALDDAYNRNDAAAAAALFTEDAVLLAPDGMFSGRQHIDFNCSRDRIYFNATDNAVWSAGQYRGQAGPVFEWGYWSAIYVREGDAWKIRMLTLGEHQQPAPFSISCHY